MKVNIKLTMKQYNIHLIYYFLNKYLNICLWNSRLSMRIFHESDLIIKPK